MKFHYLVGAAVYVAAAQPAVAQSAANDTTIIVSATRSGDEETARNTADSVTVIDATALDRRQARQVSDVLRDVPGIAVSALPGQTQLRLRGGEANHVLILVDGIEVSDPFAGEFDMSLLVADPAARIEVLRGQQSALYGSDAIGGVVHYITGSGRDAPGYGLRVEGGSFGTINAAARTAGVAGTFDYALTGSLQSTDGTPGARGSTRDLGSDSHTLALKTGIEIASNARVTAVARYVSGEGDFNSTDGNPASPTFGFIVDTLGLRYENEALYGLLRGDLALLDGGWTHALTAQFADSKRDTFRTAGRSSGSEGTRYKGSYETSLRFDTQAVSHRVTFAVDAERESARNTDPSGFPFTGRRDFDNIGLVGEYDVRLGDAASIGVAVRHDINDLFDDITTARANAAIALGAHTTLRGAYGTGIKNPGFYELYGFVDGRFIGNPGLQPEYSTGWEIGLDQRFGDGRSHASITWFDSTLTDEIFVQFLPPTFVATPSNRESLSRRRGIEISGTAYLADGLRFDGAYTFLDATENGVQEVRRPRHTASAALDWNPSNGPLGVTLVIRHNGSQTDSAFTDPSFIPVTVQLDDYTLVNLAARFSVTDTIELFGRVENLLDADYEDVFSFATPGRGAYAGIRARF